MENKNAKSVFRKELHMKILRITAQGLPLFKKDLDVCFYTQQRVSEDDKCSLYNLVDNYYIHSACAFIGINASGKTSVLKAINLALSIVKNEPINHVKPKISLVEQRKLRFARIFMISANMSAVLKL